MDSAWLSLDYAIVSCYSNNTSCGTINDANKTKRSSHTGLIAGLIVALVIVLALLSLGIYRLMRKRGDKGTYQNKKLLRRTSSPVPAHELEPFTLSAPT
jgi:hypothetical protein